MLLEREVDDVEMEKEEEEAKPVKTNSSKRKVEEEEVKDKREHVNIIFIGHVGKSFSFNFSLHCGVPYLPVYNACLCIICTLIFLMNESSSPSVSSVES